MRKKQILQVVEGRVLPDEQPKKKSQVKVSRKKHREMRQRQWDKDTLDIDAFQHFKSI